ncbi:unnamed protein product [Owenia fusiformis]|uniref:Peptidase M14 domain-containing protein n=1 Tax=Owenia fusiformis TaxID=6347 RepID=A0A8J1XG46_OWEFU|nr:unnamed protein product [Owenia fusiformis]
MMRVLLFLGLVALSLAIKKRYDGDHVLSVYPTDEYTVHYMHDLYNREYLYMDLWTEPRAVFSPIVFRVTADRYVEITRQLDEAGIAYDIRVNDIQTLIDEEEAILSAKDYSQIVPEDFDAYWPFDTLMSWTEDISANRCGGRCAITSIGTSYEGRNIRLIKIGTQTNTTKRAVFIDCGIHAREWIAPATCTYFIWRLTQDYGSVAEVTRLVDTYDFFIQPVVNPDGYEYTRDVERLWRKTRSDYNDALGCIGTDGNRNYGSYWGSDEGGASDEPCSDTYHGPSEFSEVESQRQRDFILPIKDRFIAFWTVHSFGQYMLWPWGSVFDVPPNEAELDQVGQAIVDAIFNVHGRVYTQGQSAVVLYGTQGSSQDWAYAWEGNPGGSGAGIEYSYTPELRDTGTWGFELPPDQILPVGQEMWAGLQAMIREIESIGLPP